MTAPTNVVPFTPRLSRTGSDRVAVYTVREVATLLSLSLGSTYALVRAGEIPAKKMGGRWVIPKRRFHAWLDECTEPPDDHAWTEVDRTFGNRKGER